MARDLNPPEQFELAGFEPVEKPRPKSKSKFKRTDDGPDSLFFAVFPESSAAADAASIAQRLRVKHGLTGSLLKPERLHITLYHVGNYDGLPADVLAAAQSAAATVSMEQFEVVFDRATSFFNSRRSPLVLLETRDAKDLVELGRVLIAAMKLAGFQTGSSKHYPHITLLYDPNQIKEDAVEPIRWTVKEFALVHSLVGKGQYVIKGLWPLLDRAPVS